MAARLKPSQQQMSLQLQAPKANGKSACVWSCLQCQTGGHFFTFDVLKEWGRFYAWREWFRGSRENNPDLAGSHAWIPNDTQEVKNEVLTYFMRQTSLLRNKPVTPVVKALLAKCLRGDAGPSSGLMCGRFMAIGFPTGRGGKPKQDRSVELTEEQRASAIALADASDVSDDNEPLALVADRNKRKKRIKHYFATKRAQQDKAEECDEDSDVDRDDGKLSMRAAHKLGVTMTTETRQRIKARRKNGLSSMQHAVAVNFDDTSGPTLYEPSTNAVHRGSEEVLRALTKLFDVKIERLKWNQLWCESPEGNVPWCSCPLHRAGAERCSWIFSPKVRNCMRAP